MRWPSLGPRSPSSTFRHPAPRRPRANWANAGRPRPQASTATSSSPTRCAICPAGFARRFGRIDIIVNCAAFVGTSGLEGWAVPFEQQSDETWRRALEVNLTAPFVLVQAAAADLSGFRPRQRHQYFLDLRALRARLAALRGHQPRQPRRLCRQQGRADPGHPLALHHPGAARPGQRNRAGRRVPGHPGAVFEPLYRPHAAGRGWAARKTSRGRLPIWRPIYLHM